MIPIFQYPVPCMELSWHSLIWTDYLTFTKGTEWNVIFFLFFGPHSRSQKSCRLDNLLIMISQIYLLICVPTTIQAQSFVTTTQI